MDIEFSQSAAKFLQSADRPTHNHVKAGILGLIQQPPIGDIKVLQGWKPPSYRLRIGNIGSSTVICREKGPLSLYQGHWRMWRNLQIRKVIVMTAQEQEYNTLPETEQGLAYELLRRLVLAWDPDFTKLTPSECAGLEESERDLREGRTIRMEDIDWS